MTANTEPHKTPDNESKHLTAAEMQVALNEFAGAWKAKDIVPNYRDLRDEWSARETR